MKNLWGKLSRPNSLPTNQTQEEHPNNEQLHNSQHKQLIINYYNLRQLQQNLQKLTSASSSNLFNFCNGNVANTFEDIMGTLQGLVNVIQELKQQTQKNLQKIREYDRLKSMVTQHSEIVAFMEQQSAKNLTRLYEQKRTMQHQLQEQITILKQKITQNQQKIIKLSSQTTQKQQKIQILQQNLAKKQTQIQNLSKNLQQYKNKLNIMTTIQDNSLKFKDKVYTLGQKIQLSTILVYSKLRKNIYSFLQPRDFCNIELTNKQNYYICNKTFKKQYLAIMFNNQKKQLAELQENVKYYEKIYDSFPAQNIKTNAIKYLYYKIKPGGYMLPYLQSQQQYIQKNEQKQKSKLTQISSFFRKKIQHQGNNKQKPLTFQLLKNDNDFKQVYKKIQSFFDKLFGIQSAQDLKNYAEIMKKQLAQLKSQLKSHQKPFQLLCLSKYLYLQINQLYNLLQVNFALLINKHNDLKQLKKKNDDLKQNDKVLRNLVENIANDREEIQRRIFFLESQNMVGKNNLVKLQDQLKELKVAQQQKRDQNQRLSSELKKVRQKAQRCEKQKKQIQRKWQQVLNTIKQLPILIS